MSDSSTVTTQSHIAAHSFVKWDAGCPPGLFRICLMGTMAPGVPRCNCEEMTTALIGFQALYSSLVVRIMAACSPVGLPRLLCLTLAQINLPSSGSFTDKTPKCTLGQIINGASRGKKCFFHFGGIHRIDRSA